jgi:hypothetical protein
VTEFDLPAPNIPLLRKAVEWAEAEAAKTDGTGLWEQMDYITDKPCGTAYCIAGWVIATSPEAEIHDDFGYRFPVIEGRNLLWAEAGQELLGLTEIEADDLFCDRNDIEDVRYYAEQIAARVGERL